MFKADIMKLELKHIAPYLPYKLMFLEVRRGMFSNSEDIAEQSPMNVGNINSLLNGKVYRVISRKPILRPLSDLTDEILIIIFNDVDLDVVRMRFGITINYKLMSDWFKEHISLRDYNDERGLTMSAWMYNELLERHFDVFGLIENNLAIDINTLK